MSQMFIKKAAVLGAGVMGAQIAAHLANSRIAVKLFDLKSPTGNPNAIIDKALNNLGKINPNPLGSKKVIEYITAANYDDNLDELTDCDLIIEAIAERIDWKTELFHKISEHINPHAIIATNTSGLSVNQLAESIPAKLRANFCGIHFFNPPRYMSLVELIPQSATLPEILDRLEKFLVIDLGKNVIRAKDTPNFIANRIGVFSLMATLFRANEFAIPLEVVDELTGKNLGRPKSATFRTLDVVGLDTFAHVVQTMTDKCQDDGFASCYSLPKWFTDLIASGSLGQKTKAGIYRKGKDGIKIFDDKLNAYRLADNKADPQVIEILRLKTWAERLDALHKSDLPQAQFLWAVFRDVFQYCALLLGKIADTPREIDFALRWGFGWQMGIFEIWQEAGWNKVAQWINDDIKATKTISKQQLPKWVFDLTDGVYVNNQHFNIVANKLVSRNPLAFYQRQLIPELVVNEKPDLVQNVVYENASLKLWHSGDDIAILTFKTKMCTIDAELLKGLEQALDIAAEKFSAMVIWQEKEIFSAGANLEEFGFAFMMNGASAIEEVIGGGHRVIANKLYYSPIPVVAAVKGYAFGGGCEILLHCSAVVAAHESYIGLVEAGVGLLPGWGGSKEMARRAALSINPWDDLQQRYKNLAMAKVAGSAIEAKEMGFLRDGDTIVMHSRDVLYVAKQKAAYLANSGYRPPIAVPIAVFGEQGIANINAFLVNMYAGAYISEHDLFVARNIAHVLCGGEVVANSLVSEAWLLEIEKAKFAELASSEKTMARIQYMLTNGKPLRN